MPEAASHEYRVPSGAGLGRACVRNRTTRWAWIALVIFFLLASGCIRIPGESRTVSHRSPFETRRQTADCRVACLDPAVPNRSEPEPMAAVDAAQTPELNAGGFSLLSWNIFKGKKEGWDNDLQKFSRDTDILILQEAYLTDSLKKMLAREKFYWDMTTAFEYRQIEAGVLTAARTAPNFTCAFRETEPITRIPKTVLITRYPMSETDLELIVANIHGINFTINNSAFRKQFDRLESILAVHRGPMIVSGDFNTWSAGRMTHVTAMADRLGLTSVRFDDNRRLRFIGHDVDHVFYRGLEAKNAAIPIVSTSDHSPLRVVFKLPDKPDSDH